MDTQKLRELLDQRDILDQEIAAAVIAPEAAAARPRKPQKCSVCGGEDHTARNCPSKQLLSPQ
jgi:hypothetical protein